MHRRTFLLLATLLSTVWLGCPLDIQVRCEDSSSCGDNEVCVSGLCTPYSGAGNADGDCPAAVPLDGYCRHDCECAVPGASCTTSRCAKECAADTECPEDWRCAERTQECEFGPRLGEKCFSDNACPWNATCSVLLDVCMELCTLDQSCPSGYQCSPDKVCVANCTAPPETLGRPCSDSMECGCGFCVNTGGQKICRLPCVFDQDCPRVEVGVCEQVGSTQKRACKP